MKKLIKKEKLNKIAGGVDYGDIGAYAQFLVDTGAQGPRMGVLIQAFKADLGGAQP